MKKLLALLLVFVLMFATVAGCSDGGEVTSSDPVSSEDVSSDEEVSSEPTDEETVFEEPVDESEPEDTADESYYDEPAEEDEEEEEDEESISTPLTPEEERLATMLAGEDAELNKDALYREGNLARLAKAIKKSKGGQTVEIVFYGSGANTAGNSDASMADQLYPSLFQEWWETNIGPCNVTKAGTENLTSINACMRVEYDVLQWKPDVVFLDFAVQDGIQSMAKTNSQGYDNLIRRILQSKTSPAVVTLLLTGAEQTTYTMNPQNANVFNTASKQQKEIAEYYNIPVIDFDTAVWDNMVELVKVTTQKEIPLITWETISLSNTVMNNDGHKMLNGAIVYFMNKVLAKLDKISTKDPAYPTEGYFGIDKYMKGSFVTVGDILDGKAKGYAFDLKKEELSEYEYYYYAATPGNTLSPYISTYRHYIPESKPDAQDREADLALEENPYYLSLEIPEVKNSETYFMFNTSKHVSRSSKSRISAFSPITLICYDASGEIINDNLKADFGYYSDCIDLGKTSKVQIPLGTTKIQFKIYTQQGTIRLLGVGEYKK